MGFYGAFYKMGIKGDHHRGYCNIAFLYLKGLGVDIDYKEGMHYLKLGWEHGDAECCHNLGYLALNGLGMPKNEKMAFDYFMKGALAGNVNCCKDLVKCYERGWGVEPDKEQALLWSDRVIIAMDNLTKTNYKTGALNFLR